MLWRRSWRSRLARSALFLSLIFVLVFVPVSPSAAAVEAAQQNVGFRIPAAHDTNVPLVPLLCGLSASNSAGHLHAFIYRWRFFWDAGQFRVSYTGQILWGAFGDGETMVAVATFAATGVVGVSATPESTTINISGQAVCMGPVPNQGGKFSYSLTLSVNPDGTLAGADVSWI